MAVRCAHDRHFFCSKKGKAPMATRPPTPKNLVGPTNRPQTGDQHLENVPERDPSAQLTTYPPAHVCCACGVQELLLDLLRYYRQENDRLRRRDDMWRAVITLLTTPAPNGSPIQ